MSMVFDMTTYRPPANRKIELYMLSGYCQQDALQEDLWPALQEVCPEQEELTVANINLLSDDMYVRMQYTTYIAAGQGDVLLMPRQELESLEAQGELSGILLDLTPYVEDGTLQVDGIELSTGMYANEMGEKGLYGIPADSLTGLYRFLCDPKDAVVGVVAFSQNQDTAMQVVNLLFSRYGSEQNAPEEPAR